MAKRFVFAPKQWRFSQLDDVMTRPRREEKLPTPAHALAQSRPSSGLAGWLASPSRPLPARRHNGGRGRHWPARCRQSSPSSGLAGWLASPSRPLPGATTAGGAALAREMLPALRAAPHYSAAHVRRLHARARPHFCRPGGALAGRAALAWTQTPAVPGSARRVRLAPNPEPADRSPGQYGKARGRRVVQAGWLRSCLLPWEWRAARSHTRACSQASGLRSTNAAARRGRGRRARRVIMHVGLPDAERVQDAEHAQDAAGPTGAALAVIAVVATAAPAVVAPTPRLCPSPRARWAA